jgi:hypothetical protein
MYKSFVYVPVLNAFSIIFLLFETLEPMRKSQILMRIHI